MSLSESGEPVRVIGIVTVPSQLDPFESILVVVTDDGHAYHFWDEELNGEILYTWCELPPVPGTAAWYEKEGRVPGGRDRRTGAHTSAEPARRRAISSASVSGR